MDILLHIKEILALSDFTEEEQNQLLQNIVQKDVGAEEIIFKEGDEGDALYVIVSGKVSIFVSQGGNTIELATLAEKSFFGEMALVSEQPRSASAVAIEQTKLIEIKKEHFMALFNKDSSMAAKISNEFLKRFNENLRKNI